VEKYYEHGLFIAFTGYEWSSMLGGDNMHMVVIFKDAADKVGKTIAATRIKPVQ
jgi:hypothetical protein